MRDKINGAVEASTAVLNDQGFFDTALGGPIGSKPAGIDKAPIDLSTARIGTPSVNPDLVKSEHEKLLIEYALRQMSLERISTRNAITEAFKPRPPVDIRIIQEIFSTSRAMPAETVAGMTANNNSKQDSPEAIMSAAADTFDRSFIEKAVANSMDISSCYLPNTKRVDSSKLKDFVARKLLEMDSVESLPNAIRKVSEHMRSMDKSDSNKFSAMSWALSIVKEALPSGCRQFVDLEVPAA